MPRNRTALEAAAGKLISAIQREWVTEAGESTSEVSEHVMNSAHDLLGAAKQGSVEQVLGGRSVTDYLGALWVRRHPAVAPAIRALESARPDGQHA